MSHKETYLLPCAAAGRPSLDATDRRTDLQLDEAIYEPFLNLDLPCPLSPCRSCRASRPSSRPNRLFPVTITEDLSVATDTKRHGVDDSTVPWAPPPFFGGIVRGMKYPYLPRKHPCADR